MRINASTPDVSTDSLAALWEATIPKGARAFPNWVKVLSRIFEQEGLIDVEEDWQGAKRHTVMAMHWCNLPIHEMISARLRPTNPKKAAEIDALIQGVSVQSRKGAVYSFDYVTVVGRKSPI